MSLNPAECANDSKFHPAGWHRSEKVALPWENITEKIVLVRGCKMMGKQGLRTEFFELVHFVGPGALGTGNRACGGAACCAARYLDSQP